MFYDVVLFIVQRLIDWSEKSVCVYTWNQYFRSWKKATRHAFTMRYIFVTRNLHPGDFKLLKSNNHIYCLINKSKKQVSDKKWYIKIFFKKRWKNTGRNRTRYISRASRVANFAPDHPSYSYFFFLYAISTLQLCYWFTRLLFNFFLFPNFSFI